LGHPHPAAAEKARKGYFRHTFREGHDGGNGKRRRATNEDINFQGDTQSDSFSMMGGNAAVNLIMNPDLFVGTITTARKLNPVHSHV
jgi:hypothetical protein